MKPQYLGRLLQELFWVTCTLNLAAGLCGIQMAAGVGSVLLNSNFPVKQKGKACFPAGPKCLSADLCPAGVLGALCWSPGPRLLNLAPASKVTWIDIAEFPISAAVWRGAELRWVGGQDSRVTRRGPQLQAGPLRGTGLSSAWTLLGHPINRRLQEHCLLHSFHFTCTRSGCPSGDSFLAKQTAESIFPSPGEV